MILLPHHSLKEKWEHMYLDLDHYVNETTREHILCFQMERFCAALLEFPVTLVISSASRVIFTKSWMKVVLQVSHYTENLEWESQGFDNCISYQ